MWINELELELGQSVASSILDSISDLFTLTKLGELFTLSSGSPSLADLVIQQSFLWVVLQVAILFHFTKNLKYVMQCCQSLKKNWQKLTSFDEAFLTNGTCIRVFYTPYLMSGQLVRLRVHNLHFEWKFNCFYILIIKVSIKARCSHGQNWLY